MELKQVCQSYGGDLIELLIVPYGIETLKMHQVSSVPSLLIVPYGIETCVLP